MCVRHDTWSEEVHRKTRGYNEVRGLILGKKLRCRSDLTRCMAMVVGRVMNPGEAFGSSK